MCKHVHASPSRADSPPFLCTNSHEWYVHISSMATKLTLTLAPIQLHHLDLITTCKQILTHTNLLYRQVMQYNQLPPLLDYVK